MTGRKPAAHTTGSRCKGAIAWLAVLALLINALIPASLAVAGGQDAPALSGWCGAGLGHQPAKPDPATVCNHCILCAPTATALGPPAAAQAGAPTPITVPIRPGLAPDVLRQVLRNKSAQPRGPPSTARA